jgi:hypothetical protein
MRDDRHLPDPTPAAVALWLKQINREQLHHHGWVAANRRFHGVSRAIRPFINEHFKTDAEQEAAFDGITIALLAMAHFEDIEKLAGLFAEQLTTADQTPQDKKPTTQPPSTKIEK